MLLNLKRQEKLVGVDGYRPEFPKEARAISE
jgi:hypothetical protein